MFYKFHLAINGIVALLVLLTHSNSAQGDDFKLIPEVSLREEYDDNTTFSINNPEEDYITTLGVGLDLKDRTEILDLTLSGLVSPFFYRDHDELNDTDMDFHGNVRYQVTQRVSVNANGAYRLDNRPGRDLESTGLVFDNNERLRHKAGGGVSFALSEIDNVSLAYLYDRNTWQEESALHEDYSGNSGSLTYAHNISRWIPASEIALNVGYGDYAYETSETQSAFGTIGFRRMLNELFSVNVYAGARYSDSTFDVIQDGETETRNETTWNAIGGTRIGYQGERAMFSLNLSHDLRTADGRQGAANLTRAMLDMGYRLYENLLISVSAKYFKNETDADEHTARETDEGTLHIRPSISWEFTDHLTLDAGYNYTHLDNKINDTQAERNVVYLQLIYVYPLFDMH